MTNNHNTENILDAPKVDGVGYTRIVKTLPSSGEVIDAHLYVYTITDMTADGAVVRHYEAAIEENAPDNSVDSDRLLLSTVFEITPDVLDGTRSVQENIIQGSWVTAPERAWRITGPDMVFYSALLGEYGIDAAAYLFSLDDRGVFVFDDAAYDHTIYDSDALASAINDLKRNMLYDVEMASVDADIDDDTMVDIDDGATLDDKPIRMLEDDLDIVDMDALLNTTENQYSVYDTNEIW